VRVCVREREWRGGLREGGREGEREGEGMMDQHGRRHGSAPMPPSMLTEGHKSNALWQHTHASIPSIEGGERERERERERESPRPSRRQRRKASVELAASEGGDRSKTGQRGWSKRLVKETGQRDWSKVLTSLVKETSQSRTPLRQWPSAAVTAMDKVPPPLLARAPSGGYHIHPPTAAHRRPPPPTAAHRRP
jgi:hypothetical protein